VSSGVPEPSRASSSAGSDSVRIDKATRAKIEAVIKDAGQYVVAIVFCFICSAAGFVLIGPWYWVRLRQWHALAEKYPSLMTANPEHGSLADRFQGAKGQLLIGMRFGAGICLLVLAVVIVAYWQRR
jgi:hypothetical protein